MPTPSARPTRKAVIPVAGLGTRFLPATKAVPKELLPVVDRPALQYIVEEAARGGSVIALLDVGRENIDKYGAVAVEPAAAGDDVVAITGLVEKPPVDEAPSS